MDKRLKIFHLALSLKAGGLERVVHDLAAGIDPNRFEVEVACLNEGGALLDDLQQNGIRARVLGKRPVTVDIALVKQVRQHLRDREIDVLHTHSGCMMYGALCAVGNRRLARIHTDHGRFFPEPRQALIEEWLFCRPYQKIVAVSQPLAKYLRNKVRIPERKLEVILNGVDTERFCPPHESRNANRQQLIKEYGWESDNILMGVVARFFPVKNIPLLISAHEILHTRWPTLRLVLVGEGPEKENLRSLIRERHLEQSAQILSWTEDVERIYQMLDIFVLPSYSEGTSMTILEAMASGLPVIASRVGGNPNLVEENETGLLFESANLEALVEALEALLSTEQRRNRMGSTGRRRALEQFSLKTMLNRYSDLYTSSRMSKGDGS